MQGSCSGSHRRGRSGPCRREEARNSAEKLACSDTIDESSSLAHPVLHFPPSPHHYRITSTLLFTTLSPAASRLKLEVSRDLCRPSSVLTLLNNLGRGGYAGVRLGEPQNLGPGTHDRDWAAAEQRIASLLRINEAGDSLPCSQDSVTRGDIRHPQFRAAPAPPPRTGPNRRRPPQARPKQQPREYLRCAQCGSDLRARPHPAHGSETRGTTAAPRKASGSCAIPTVQLVQLVAPSGRGDVDGAPSSEVITRTPECSVWWLDQPSATTSEVPPRCGRSLPTKSLHLT